MPIRVPWVPQTIDAPAVASKLPEPLQWAGGAALEGLKQLTGIGTGDPNSVMQVGAPLMAAESEGAGMGALRGLYSRVQRAAESLPDWVHPAKALSTLKNLASKEEMDFRGVGDFLGERQGPQKMPKADLLQHLAENPAPDVRVKTLSNRADMGLGQYEQPLGAGGRATFPQETQYNRPDLNVPGGKNYTESLFQLDTPSQNPEREALKNEIESHGFAFTRTNPRMLREAGHVDLADRLKDYIARDDQESATYRSSHWGEPNVLVHTREDVRPDETGALGRFLQEVQSDWHQQGKEEGYDAPGFKATNPVPDAPFKDTWPDLALKKHVMDVANDPNLDWLGFTTGETQNKRYNLAPHIDRLEYEVTGSGPSGFPTGGNLWGYKNGETVFHKADIAPDAVKDYIGEGLHSKLFNPDNINKWLSSYHRTGPFYNPMISGEDMSLGGEGMKSFYDQLLPKRLEKILKPFGGSVEQGAVQTSTNPMSYRADPNYPGRVLATGPGFRSDVPVASIWPRHSNLATSRSMAAQDEALANILTKQAPSIYGKTSIEPAWLARFTPEMKVAIKEKGLPLLSLLGLMKAVPSHSQQDSQ